jgi:hypothetical protein
MYITSSGSIELEDLQGSLSTTKDEEEFNEQDRGDDDGGKGG